MTLDFICWGCRKLHFKKQFWFFEQLFRFITSYLFKNYLGAQTYEKAKSLSRFAAVTRVCFQAERFQSPKWRHMFPFSFFSLSFPLVFRSNLHSNKNFLTLRSRKPPLFFCRGWGEGGAFNSSRTVGLEKRDWRMWKCWKQRSTFSADSYRTLR